MPKSNIKAVNLSIEYDSEEFRAGDSDTEWLSDKATTFAGGPFWCVLDIAQTTKEFKDSLGVMEEKGCSQRLINHIKYARGIGARWIMFS